METDWGSVYIKKSKLHGLSTRANYTDRATAACRRSDFLTFCVRDPYGRILVFIDRSC
jgi:hypothetical protein